MPAQQKAAQEFANRATKRFKEAESTLPGKQKQLEELQAVVRQAQADVLSKKQECTKAGEDLAKIAMHAANVASTAASEEAITAVSFRMSTAQLEANEDAKKALDLLSSLNGITGSVLASRHSEHQDSQAATLQMQHLAAMETMQAKMEEMQAGYKDNARGAPGNGVGIGQRVS